MLLCQFYALIRWMVPSTTYNAKWIQLRAAELLLYHYTYSSNSCKIASIEWTLLPQSETKKMQIKKNRLPPTKQKKFDIFRGKICRKIMRPKIERKMHKMSNAVQLNQCARILIPIFRGFSCGGCKMSFVGPILHSNSTIKNVNILSFDRLAFCNANSLLLGGSSPSLSRIFFYAIFVFFVCGSINLNCGVSEPRTHSKHIFRFSFGFCSIPMMIVISCI